ncbi:MAG: outer membrane lipoprotein-sorting protein [Bacteroidales bacterium]|nr:outer membrane lipoprotein-sorting protein [Bacteroidales bacterium]
MKRTIIIIMLVLGGISLLAQDADQILDRIDQNMSSDNRIFESEMIIHGRRNSRTITSLSYSVGDKQSFIEYLSPAREQGTKMLKLEDALWIYSPSTDRIIQISGHMLRQSVMGSDLSYEDMMDDRKLQDIYEAKVESTETFDEREVWVLKLTAIVDDATYHSQKIWVDTERYVPLKQEMYAKSGQLLKRTTLTNITKVQGRWFPMSMVYKDMLKDGKGTEFRINSVKFNQEIPNYIFTKAALKQ